MGEKREKNVAKLVGGGFQSGPRIALYRYVLLFLVLPPASNYFPYSLYLYTSIEAASMDALPYSCQRQSTVISSLHVAGHSQDIFVQTHHAGIAEQKVKVLQCLR